MADHRQFGAMGCQHVSSKTGHCAKSGRLTVQQNAICGCECPGQLRGENSDQHIGVLLKISAARNHCGRADLGFKGAYQNPNHHVARRQFGSSDSSASRRLREAALNSVRSSSDQESDQSIFPFGVTPANRWARADNSAAVSGGRRRKASTSDASRALSCISITLQPVYGLSPAAKSGLHNPCRHTCKNSRLRASFIEQTSATLPIPRAECPGTCWPGPIRQRRKRAPAASRTTRASAASCGALPGRAPY